MSNAPEDVMAFILSFEELSLAEGQVFTEIEADTAFDPAISIYSRSTEPVVQTHDTYRPAIETVRLQIVVRSRKYSEAEAMAYRVYDSMWDYEAPYPYDFIWPMGQPTSQGAPDANARWGVGFAVRAQRSGGIRWL